MIDIKLLRENAELVRANCIRRGAPIDFDALIATDERARNLLTKVENLRAERNRLSKECKTNPEAREQVKALKVAYADGSTETMKISKVNDTPSSSVFKIPSGYKKIAY